MRDVLNRAAEVLGGALGVLAGVLILAAFAVALRAVRIKPRFAYLIGLAANKKRRNSMIEITITDEQKIQVTLSPTTATGKPAKLDGAPVWSVVSGNSTVQPAADGLSAELISEDNPGDTVFQVDADADLGAGVVRISDQVTLHVVDAQAQNLGLAAGQPETK